MNDVYGQYEAVFPGDEEHGVHSLKANVILPGKVDSSCQFRLEEAVGLIIAN